MTYRINTLHWKFIVEEGSATTDHWEIVERYTICGDTVPRLFDTARQAEEFIDLQLDLQLELDKARRETAKRLERFTAGNPPRIYP